MNGFILFLVLISLLLNIVFGNVLDVYPLFNMGINCGVIAFTAAFLFALKFSAMATAFRISLSGLFSFLGLVMLALGILSPAKWENNKFVIAICLIVAFEAIVLAVCNVVSKFNSEVNANGK
jgi:hypothetical protein